MVESSFGSGGWQWGRKARCEGEGEREAGTREDKLELMFFFTSSLSDAGISWHSVTLMSGPGVGEAKENDLGGDRGVVGLGAAQANKVSLIKGTCTRAALRVLH